MTNVKIVHLNQASFLCEGIEKNLDEIGIVNYDHQTAWANAVKLSEGKYKRCLALLFNHEYDELRKFLRELEIIK
jgi:hypothetical protein